MAAKDNILQDLTQLENYISMKASKTENWFSTTKNRFAKQTGINIPTFFKAIFLQKCYQNYKKDKRNAN